MTAPLRLTSLEKRSALALGLVFFLRMLGLFMLIPVLALYVDTLRDATPFLIGTAIGIYGLTQALLQIPLGSLSDRIGRKPVIVGGLVVFIVGALLAAWSDSIWPVIAGRAIQGLGAVSGASLALAADLSRDNQRTKIMAIIGVSIGAAFSVAFVLGPALNAVFGLRGVFMSGAVLACAAIPIVIFAVPGVSPRTANAQSGRIAQIIVDRDLRVLYVGVLSLHLILAASFVAIPIGLVESMHLAAAQHYEVYLPVLALSLLVAGPLIGLSSRKQLGERFFYISVGLLSIAELLLWLFWNSVVGFLAALTLFFAAFNFLEASLPGLISRAAPSARKGTALGAYSSFQFIGVFLGGMLGGVIAGQFGYTCVPLASALLGAVWWIHCMHSRKSSVLRPTAR
ncbi:MAG: MFS transporter [Gammaproteobacteria bacterium]